MKPYVLIKEFYFLWGVILNLSISQDCSFVLSIFFSNSALSFYFSQFHRAPNWFPSLLMLKIGSANQGFINWYQSFGSWVRCYLSFVFCVLCFMCVSSFVCSLTFLFNYILLFHLPLFYFFEFIFLFWTISSINIFLSFFFI